MPTKKYNIELTDNERRELTKIVKNGTSPAKVINRANILLASDSSTGKAMTVSSLKINRYYSVLLVVFAVLLNGMLVLSGCSTAGAIDKEVSPSIQQPNSQTEETMQPVDHNVDMDPTPLEDAEKALSLEGYGAKGALIDTDLTINDMLMYAVQDEYLARGEYLAIIDKFGSQRPYSNIVNSEETHLAFLQEVYISYGLDFPSDTSADHIIIPSDLLEAAKTGVRAEIDNIAMYELFLTYELPDNVIEVFTALKNGSDSHLLAFQKQVDRLS